MTDRDIERKIKTALEHAAPNDIDGVLSRCGEQKGRVISMTNNTPKKKFRAIPALIAACLTLVLLGGGLWTYQANAVASVVSLDVNPSIELKVNRNEKVLSADPLNADARTVLEGMDLEGTDLNVAVNAIIGSLLQNGYFDSISSAILISVEDANTARAERLESSLTAQVDTALQSANANAAIMSQTIVQDAGLETQAHESNISVGKAALISAIREQNSSLDFNALAALSVDELRDLRQVGAPAMPIGKEAAAAIAQEYVGTTALSSVYAEVDSELDDRVPHYDVELNTAFGEFEYEIDAFTGEVLRGRSDIVPSQATQPDSVTPPAETTDPVTPSTDDIGRDSALAAAVAHAGVSSSGVTDVRIERDYDDGRLEYEVEFWVDSVEYDYEINGSTGAVIRYEQENHGTGAATRIGKEAARDAALAHAGFVLSAAYDIEVDEEFDERTPHYEVSFSSGSMEYEYSIDASSGEVLSYEQERDD